MLVLVGNVRFDVGYRLLIALWRQVLGGADDNRWSYGIHTALWAAGRCHIRSWLRRVGSRPQRLGVLDRGLSLRCGGGAEQVPVEGVG
jgi:hypothetical protein